MSITLAARIPNTPVLDPVAFLNVEGSSSNKYLWSSTVDASYDEQAWAFNVMNGQTRTFHMSSGGYHVRCVRETDPTPRCFQADAAAGNQPVVNDPTMNLMWRGCVVGTTGSNCMQGWQDAVNYPADNPCDAWNGYDDWRMPSLYELSSLFVLSNSYPAIPNGLFPNFLGSGNWSNYYWSSTIDLHDSNLDRYWAVDLVYGNIDAQKAFQNSNYIMCVRNIND